MQLGDPDGFTIGSGQGCRMPGWGMSCSGDSDEYILGSGHWGSQGDAHWQSCPSEVVLAKLS